MLETKMATNIVTNIFKLSPTHFVSNISVIKINVTTAANKKSYLTSNQFFAISIRMTSFR